MLAVLTVLSVFVASTSAQSYSYAVDIVERGNVDTFSCLKSNGYATVFIRAYQKDGNGTVDHFAVGNVKAASYYLSVEAYVTPSPKGSKSAKIQIDEAINNLVNAGISLRTLWLQVTDASDWNANQTVNTNFINEAVQRIRARGIRPGVYTNKYDWDLITNGATNTGSDVLLWYWNVYWGESSGETPPNFDDFLAFGPFSSPSVKQFGQDEYICDFTLNRDAYPNASGKMINSQKSKEIVVGAIGL